MRGFLVIGIVAGLALGCVPRAFADTFNKTVKSGVKQRVHMYMHWAGDCTSRSGIVRVVSKPEHGTLTPSLVDTTIKQNRFNLGDKSCVGRAIKGFQVEYRSKPGYRGTDTFTIEATYQKRQAFDVYLITVE